MDEETDNNVYEDEIKKLVEDTATINMIFNEPTNMLNDLKRSYGSRNYASVLENSKRVMDMMSEPTEKFIRVGTAFSISAAAEWISTLAESGVDTSEAQDLILKAREEFSGGDFNRANETVGEISVMFPRLEEEQAEVAKEGISSTEELIEEAKDIGANVIKAVRAIQQAKNSLEAENFVDVARYTREAREGAENAKEKRIQTISDALLFTRSVIDESREVGVDTSEPDSIYEEAKDAFENEDYNKCSELNKQAEERALQLQDEHIQRVMALKDKRAEILEKMAAREAAVGAETEVAGEEPTTEEEPSAEGAEEGKDLCPTCGAEMRWVEKYSRHWCRSCKKYAPKS